MARRKPKFYIYAKVGTWPQSKVWVWDLKSIVPGSRIEWMENGRYGEGPEPNGPVHRGVVDSIDSEGLVRISRM